MRHLQNMVVVITGASAGIGEELARQLHTHGAKLVLAARRIDRLHALNTQLGGNHVVAECDVAKQDDCNKLIDIAYARLGRIDTFVANAGYGLYPLTHETTPQQVRDIFATNVFGTTDCIYAAVRRMIEQPERDRWRGQVVIVSSVAARRGVPYLGVYSATKAAQLSIAEAMRVELSEHKIAVTSVHPIMTKTDFGNIAESLGAIQLPKSSRDRMTQPVDHVARHIVRAIERPRAEVWPSRLSRWIVGLGTLAPRLVDRAMRRYAQNVARQNAP
jgi:short-subunit dehydrogenase